MDDAATRSRRRATWLAWGAVGGVVVFNLGWLLAGAVQGGGYSVASHDISDLGALTARSPWVMLTAQGIAGTLIILFALFALGPALAVPGRGPALGAWLLAASLIGLDNLSDAFFRLDCRAADQGCTAAAAASSWHGRVHLAVGLLSGIATILLPFVLAARMRHADGWRDLARPTILAGVLLVAVLVAYVAFEGKTGGGYLQRAAIVLFSAGVVTLALRVRALARSRDVVLQR
ncbi:MAG TPA: DUF998 domain-containing protein [Actinomycetes bacterium]|nr:DUF998 domain-containing protein [Actinomycetes bacterium]